ncbi:MAG: TIGR00730 family Rossman fold protein [Hyphomicrobiales bacterium]|nr:MAG: TIGR00730 family Rossman fold protein [Hyphomicrobiales bacterium]
MSSKSICIYCGSQNGKNPEFVGAARILGKALAENSIRLVYGGGTSGIMGEVARAVADNNGEIVGIIPQFLLNLEAGGTAPSDLGEVIVTEDMHQRKHMMFERADAFVALPGGIGTLEEIIEVMTWAQLGRHTKPMGFLNIDGFWDPVIELVDHMNKSGFIHSIDKVRPHVINSADQVVPTIMDAIAHAEKASEKNISKM